MGVFGNRLCVIDYNSNIISLVDRQVFRRSTVGTLNGHVTLAGDICVVRYNAVACRKDHFAGIINVQASVHSPIFVAADIHLTGAVDRAGITSGENRIILITADRYIMCLHYDQFIRYCAAIFSLQFYILAGCVDFLKRPW